MLLQNIRYHKEEQENYKFFFVHNGLSVCVGCMSNSLDSEHYRYDPPCDFVVSAVIVNTNCLGYFR